VRIDCRTTAGMYLEVEVRDAELRVAGLPECADRGAGRDRTQLAIPVEVRVVVAVAVDTGEPDRRPTERVLLGLGDTVDNGEHRDAALSDHVDTLVPTSATARRAPRVGE